MSDLQEAIALVASIRMSLILATADISAADEYDRWRIAKNTSERAAEDRLVKGGASVRMCSSGDRSIRLAGIHATSTGGISGAVSNWLKAARSRAEAGHG